MSKSARFRAPERRSLGRRLRGGFAAGPLAAVLASSVLVAGVAPVPGSASAVPDDAAQGGRNPSFDTVVIDAGHGGGDHGAESPSGLLEKDVVLDVAERLAARLRGRGIDVVLTRSSDRFVALDERTALANAASADLFVSIHANASDYRSVRGVETFFASADATDEAARDLARKENAAFGPAALEIAAGDPVLAILGDMLANEHLADSQEFARMAQAHIQATAADGSRGIKQAPFVVLMGVRMPAVLVEIGFLTNRDDERALGGARERDRIADGLAEAIERFSQRQARRFGAAATGAAVDGGGR